MARLRAQPMWFRIVAILLVLWGLAGAVACIQQIRLGAEAMGPSTAYDRALFARLPAWYHPVYAVAVGAGLAGAIALLLCARAARALFVVSLIAVIVQFGWVFAATNLIAAKGAATTVPFPVLIFAIAVFQIWLAGRAIQRGWIR